MDLPPAAAASSASTDNNENSNTSNALINNSNNNHPPTSLIPTSPSTWQGDADEDLKQDAIRQFRRKLEHFLLTSILGFLLDVGDVLFSIVACCLYIAQSYFPYDERTSDEEYLVYRLDLASLALALFFLTNFLLALFVADQKIRFLFSFSSAIDVVTISPLIIIWFPHMYHSQIHFNMPRFDFLRFVRVLKILRILRLQRLLGLSDSEVQRQIFTVSLTVLSIIICYAGLFQVIENAFATRDEMALAWNGPERVWFHDAVYFTVVTIATVGYGDFFPITVLGKFLVMMMIATTIIIVSQQTNKLLTLMSLKSVYARNQFQATASTSHIVVCGYINFTSANNFFKEFFHEDHGARDTSVVLLSPSLPSSGLEWLLRLPEYAYRSTYLEGSAMNPKDLDRAAVDKANAVFILGDKTSSDPHGMDAASILRAMAVKKYVSQVANGENILVVLQLLRPENKHHFALSGFGKRSSIPKSVAGYAGGISGPMGDDNRSMSSFSDGNTTSRSVSGQAKRSVLSRLVGGSRAASITAGDDPTATNNNNNNNNASADMNEKARIRHRYSLMKDQVLCTDEIKLSLIAKSCLCPGFSTLISNLITSSSLDADDDKFDPWMREYVQGTGHEIYRASLSRHFVGMKFSEMAIAVFRELSSLVFAIEIADVRGEVRVVLNPSEYVISRTTTHVYVLCEDKIQADKLAYFGEDRATNRTSTTTTSSAKKGGTIVDMNESTTQADNTNTSINNNNTTTTSRRPVLESAGGAFARSSESNSNNNSLPASPVPNRPTISIPGGGGETSSPSRIPANSDGGIMSDHELDLDQRLSQLKTLFHVSSSPITLESATRNKVTPEISEHILVCGSVTGLYHFVAPLRSKYLTTIVPIVVLHPDRPVREWESICYFEKVFYVQGSVLEPADLIRAGALTVSKAVVLSNLSTAVDEEGKEHMVDADSIFAFQSVLQANRQIKRSPMPYIVCELVNPHNISFLMSSDDAASSENTNRSADSFLAPPFTAGNVYVPSVLDMLACQAYYNQHLLTILQELVLVGVTSIAQFRDANVKPSFLFQIPIPQECVKCTYGDLFTYLSQRGALPLALYRSRESEEGSKDDAINNNNNNSSSSNNNNNTNNDSSNGNSVELKRKPTVAAMTIAAQQQQNNLPYVVTNPDPETVLRASDLVFILSVRSLEDEGGEGEGDHNAADDVLVTATSVKAEAPPQQQRRLPSLESNNTQLYPVSENAGGDLFSASAAASSSLANIAPQTGIAALMNELIKEVRDIKKDMLHRETEIHSELSHNRQHLPPISPQQQPQQQPTARQSSSLMLQTVCE